MEELREIFVKMDENGSGTISLDEFRRAMSGQNVGDLVQLFNMIVRRALFRRIKYQVSRVQFAALCFGCTPPTLASLLVLPRGYNNMLRIRSYYNLLLPPLAAGRHPYCSAADESTLAALRLRLSAG